MALLERVQADMVAAMKARDEARLNALRMIKAALQKHQIDSMKALDDAAEQQVMKQLVKQRTEAAEMFRKGGRAGQAEKEEAERTLIQSYMPAEASEEDVAQAIEAALAETGITSLKQMGVVMKATQAKLTGKRVDGKALSEKVRSRLQ
ncbi:MAG TPA: GatB/YqeY domain-containing protein [Bryobacteraceae bacterium]|nr:GatB/YqeY domain-containing protein [Bryobacteraceae bacterium]